MKIVAFGQLHNELKKGNLENWFKCVTSICDKIYIYDQASTDNSQEYYKKFDNTHVIYSEINDFSNETLCKAKLLNLIKEKEQEGDWIFWLDGDTFLERKANNKDYMYKLLYKASKEGCDAIRVGHYNLWRSDIYYRVDSLYHWLHEQGVLAFWKLSSKISFPDSPGLHGFQFPDGITKCTRPGISLIHRGFATDYQIITKYNTYKNRGQSGKDLTRLLNENGLQIKELDLNILPNWAPKDTTRNPFDQKLIREIYNEL